jgi:hypothetical protein
VSTNVPDGSTVNPAGWYPDPFARAQVRWWSGSGWTDHVATDGREYLDPPVGAPASLTQVAAPQAGVAPQALAVARTAARTWPTTWLALVAVAALVAGGALGYVLRGDGSSGRNGTDSSSTGSSGSSSGSLAVPILQGMASLDSYEWTLQAKSVGPTAADSSEITANGMSDRAGNTSYQKQSTTTSSADDPTPSTNVNEYWRLAQSVCQFDGEEYTTDARSPFEIDLGNVISGVFDIVIPSGDAKLLGEEEVAGVPARHYSFVIKGLGTASGTQVDANEGQLWVAKDGDYMVKYQVTAAMRTAPSSVAEAEQTSIDLKLELTSVNQPVSVTAPPGCPA